MTSPQPGPDPEPDRRDALVGRRREQDLISRFVRDLPRIGGVFVVRGEAGIGKTRLLREARDLGATSGFRCLATICAEPSKSTSYAPWIDLLRQNMGRSTRAEFSAYFAEHRAVLSAVLPELARLVWLFDPTAQVDAFPDRARFVAALARAVAALGTSRPTLLTIDDIGWADPASLELLGTLAIRGPDRGLGIMVAFRSAHFEENRPLRQTLTELAPRRASIELNLGPIERAALGDLLGQRFGGGTVSPDLGDLLFARSGGNPFFAVEMADSLLDNGLVVARNGEWVSSGSEPVALPRSVTAAIEERLERLDERARGVLRVAAVLGLEFEFEVLVRSTDGREESVLQAIEQGRSLQLLREHPSEPGRARISFAHPLIQEELVKELSQSRGLIVHRRAARALEQLAGGREDDLAGTIAYHLARSDRPDSALPWTIRAGERAARVYSRTEAAQQFRLALGILQNQPDPSRTGRVEEALARQLRFLGELGDAAIHYERAADAFERSGDTSSALECLSNAALNSLDSLDRRLALFERGRSLMGGGEPSAGLARWHAVRAELMSDIGRTEEALAESTEALRIARLLSLPDHEVAALMQLPFALPPNRWREVGEAIERMVALIEEHHLEERRPEVVFYRSLFDMHFRGEPRRALGLAGPAERIIRGVGDVLSQNMWSDIYVPWGRLHAGDLAGALSQTTRGLAARAGSYHRGMLVSLHAWISSLHGPPEEAEGRLREALEALRAHPEWAYEAETRSYLGRLRLVQGDLAEALEELDRAGAVFRRAGPPAWFSLFYAEHLSHAVRAALRHSDPARAAAHRQELDALAAVFDTPPAQFFTYEASGACLAAEGRHEAALKATRAARDGWEQLGWRFQVALTWQDEGDAEARRGDWPAARVAYEKACAEYTACGAEPSAEAVRARLAEGTRRSPER